MRWSRHHGLQRTETDRIIADREARRAERDRVRVDAPDETVCWCGWITARDTCPMCDLVRIPDSQAEVA